MTELLAQARALRDSVTATDVIDLFLRGGEGERIVALGLVQAEPTADLFDLVLDGISASRSAFEQFTAMSAALDMLPALSRQQRDYLAEALEAERTDVRGTGPQADASRWQLMNQLQRRLVPPQSATRADAVQFERRVRQAIEMAEGVAEITQPTGLGAGVDYILLLGDRRVAVEAKYAIGPNQARRVREALQQVEHALRQLSADAGLVVLPQPILGGPEGLDPRIRFTTPEELPSILNDMIS
jgi:hypothetical protein